jgi:hypothetical protein
LLNLKPKALYYSHFGNASNAVEKLQTYIRQIRLWARIAKQGIDNHESLDRIRQRIVEGDPAVKKAEEHIKAHPVLSDTTLHESVQGFIDFVEKYPLPP